MFTSIFAYFSLHKVTDTNSLSVYLSYIVQSNTSIIQNSYCSYLLDIFFPWFAFAKFPNQNRKLHFSNTGMSSPFQKLTLCGRKRRKTKTTHHLTFSFTQKQKQRMLQVTQGKKILESLSYISLEQWKKNQNKLFLTASFMEYRNKLSPSS